MNIATALVMTFYRLLGSAIKNWELPIAFTVMSL